MRQRQDSGTRRDWSKQGRAREGRAWQPAHPADCYYCGVPGCTECGEPPALLRDLIDDDTDGGDSSPV